MTFGLTILATFLGTLTFNVLMVGLYYILKEVEEKLVEQDKKKKDDCK